MKHPKKAIAMIMLAVMMIFASQQEVMAWEWTLINPIPETLEFGKAYNITYPSERDKYHQYNMHLPQSGSITITVDTDGRDDMTSHWIKDSADNRITDRLQKNGTYNYTTYLLAGDYVLCMGSNDPKTNISFVVSFTPSGETVSEEYMHKNNMLGTATPYVLGSKIKAQFAANDDKDIYKFKVSKPGYLTLTCNNDMKSLDMQLVSEDNSVCYNESGILLGANKYKYFVPKGTYYLSFQKDEDVGTYTFSAAHSRMSVSKIKQIKNLEGKKAKITWTKKSDADGYHIQVATDKKFKKNLKSKKLTTYSSHPKSYTFTKLKKGKTYYSRVRTYKLVNGKKNYSDWSTVKSFKVKK